MSSTKRSLFWKVVSVTFSAALIVSAAWLILNRQFVYDQLSVWSYTPSSAIQTIDTRVTFTEKGSFLFYATQPIVASQEEFNKSCPRQEVGSPILGCYTGDGKIYIYDITNEKLDGMEEVTAAHEMLHAVWQRLSQADKDRLSTQLKAVYATIDDEELHSRMDYYERTEPGEAMNELHSILGTEQAQLSPELEAHYAQYFDRKAVLTLYNDYNSQYKQLTSRADELYAVMDTLGKSIQTRLGNYDTASKQLSADIASFNARADAGEFSSTYQFNIERSALLSRSDQLELDRQSVNADVDTYNGYHTEYETIAAQLELLNQSIDSFRTIDQTPSL